MAGQDTWRPGRGDLKGNDELRAEDADDALLAEDVPLSASGILARVPWGIGDIAWVLGLTVMTLVLLYTVAGILISVLGIRHHAGQELGAGLIATFFFELCLFGIAAGFSVGKYHLSWSQFGLRGFPLQECLVSLMAVAGCYGIVATYIVLATALRLHWLLPTPNLPTGIFDSRSLIPLAGFEACLVAPIVEESFFRGFLFHGLLGKRFRLPIPGRSVTLRLGFWAAAIASGLLFAAFHAQLGLLIPFTAVGVLFAWLYWRSGSLWANILTHAGFNLVSFSVSLALHH
ncbi:MAG: CPBP family intramembrane glutamic endopeptidase [Dehalococcoidia bacterium]